MSIKNTYYPDYAIHPGEYLEEIMNERGLKKSDLAMRSGLEHKQINQILGKNEDISSHTALALEKALGVSAAIWKNLNSNYLLFQAKREENQRIQPQRGITK